MTDSDETLVGERCKRGEHRRCFLLACECECKHIGRSKGYLGNPGDEPRWKRHKQHGIGCDCGCNNLVDSERMEAA